MLDAESFVLHDTGSTNQESNLLKQKQSSLIWSIVDIRCFYVIV